MDSVRKFLLRAANVSEMVGVQVIRFSVHGIELPVPQWVFIRPVILLMGRSIARPPWLLTLEPTVRVEGIRVLFITLSILETLLGSDLKQTPPDIEDWLTDSPCSYGVSFCS